MAFYQCEPWGIGALDCLFANVAALYANSHRAISKEEEQRIRAAPKRDQPFKLSEFLLFSRDDVEKDQGPKDIVRPETRDWFYRVAVPAKANDGN